MCTTVIVFVKQTTMDNTRIKNYKKIDKTKCVTKTSAKPHCDLKLLKMFITKIATKICHETYIEIIFENVWSYVLRRKVVILSKVFKIKNLLDYGF